MGRAVVRIRTLLLACAAALVLANAAPAQSPDPGHGALPPFRIAAIVRAAGFDPLFRPLRQGDTYVLRALDRNELEYRLVIDAYTGRTISINATGERGAPGPYRGPVYGRVFAPNDDSYDPRNGYVAPRPLPPQVRVPQTSKATPTPPPGPNKPTQVATPATPVEPNKTTQAPLPRPRPYVMEATSSIPADTPKSADPPKTPDAPKTADVPKTPDAPKVADVPKIPDAPKTADAPKTPDAPKTDEAQNAPPPAPPLQSPAPTAPPAAPQNNGAAAMPPVTPLD